MADNDVYVNMDQVRAEALKEVQTEEFNRRLELEKARIRRRRALPWWRRLFPYRVTIERIDA